MKIGMILAPSEQVLYSGIIPLPPHSLGVMTSYMRARGHNVRQYDLNTDLEDHYQSGHLTHDEIKVIFDKEAVLNYLNGIDNAAVTNLIEKLLAGKPIHDMEAVGISNGGTFWWMSMHMGFLIAKYIKSKYRIPVVIGGNNMIYLLSFKDKFKELWTAALNNLPHVIVGAGLESFRKCADHFEHDPQWVPSPSQRAGIGGLIYLENGQITSTPRDAHSVVKPDFKGLRLDYYMNYFKNPANASDPARIERLNLEQQYRWSPELLIIANRTYRKRARRKPGEFVKKLALPYVFQYHCPYNCAFCSESDPQNKVVLGDPVQAVDHIEEMLHDYNTDNFLFFNNYFNLSKKFALAFFAEIKRRKLKFNWSDCARFNNMDYDFIVKLKESGCKTLWLGMESASPRMLKMIDKKIDLDMMHNVLGHCKDLGIWVKLEVIVGFPNETKKDFGQTVRFLKKNADRISSFQDNRYYVVPQSLIGRFPQRYNIQLERDLVTYDKLMASNMKWFTSGKNLESKPNNFQMLPFNEIGGLKHDGIFKEGLRRLQYMNSIKSKEFHEITQMLKFMDSMENKYDVPAAVVPN